jgi:translation initiation factor IF-2
VKPFYLSNRSTFQIRLVPLHQGSQDRSNGGGGGYQGNREGGRGGGYQGNREGGRGGGYQGNREGGRGGGRGGRGGM